VAQVQRSFESICDSFLSLLAAVIDRFPNAERQFEREFKPTRS